MVHLKMLNSNLLKLCAILVVLSCSYVSEGIGCLSSQSAFDLPLASAAAVRSFTGARNESVIFPGLQFRCSGIVTHVSMSISNRAGLCTVQNDTLPNRVISEYHSSMLVWERAGRDGEYRFLGQYRLAVAAGEVQRQCVLQQEAPVVVQFALESGPASQLLVEPGQVIGFPYPFAYPIRPVDQDFLENKRIEPPKPGLDIEFVEAPSGAALVFQGSLPAVNSIITAEETPFNIAPRVGFSIDVSSVDATGSTAPAMLPDHVVILSISGVVALLLTVNALLLCAILLCVAKTIQRKHLMNGKSNVYTYPRFGLSNSQHSRRAPPTPPRPSHPQIGPQEEYEYVSSSPPESSSTHVEESNTYI